MNQAVRFVAHIFIRSGDLFQGKFEYSDRRKKWVGNPATCAEVKDLLTSVKNKAASDGGERNHSAAMSYKLLEQMTSWSESVCPFNPEDAPPLESLTIEARTILTEHVMFRALSALAFTLWTRSVDLISGLHNITTLKS